MLNLKRIKKTSKTNPLKMNIKKILTMKAETNMTKQEKIVNIISKNWDMNQLKVKLSIKKNLFKK
jgi:hypothetical protein